MIYQNDIFREKYYSVTSFDEIHNVFLFNPFLLRQLLELP